MIVDEVKISVTAGAGGDGMVTFSKTKKTLGPAGGSGGNGGSVYLEGVSDLGALRQFRFRKDFKADNGQHGKSRLNDGHDAHDLVLQVPVGTVCKNTATGAVVEITKIGQRELIAKGGKGGRGNYLFRSAERTSPMKAEEGRLGESFPFLLELKMIADVGFIGLPNVGKSSMLNELTRAKSKVANYPFTTLEPNLGAYYDLILADIPGLIAGASEGRGLGIKFLRHIERTRVLFHFVAADSATPLEDYQTVRAELSAHNPTLLEKEEHIFLTKADLVSKDQIATLEEAFEKLGKPATPLSIIDPGSMAQIKTLLNAIADEKTHLF